MEKKTNKAKLEIFKFSRKLAESPLIKLAEIVHPTVFLHAEFISVRKTVQNPTVFMKTQK